MSTRLIFVLVSVLMATKILMANSATVNSKPTKTLVGQWTQPLIKKTEISPIHVRDLNWIREFRDGQNPVQVRKPLEYQKQNGNKAQDLRTLESRYLRALNGLLKEIQIQSATRGLARGRARDDHIREEIEIDHCSAKIRGDRVEGRAQSPYHKNVKVHNQRGPAAPTEGLPAGLNFIYPAQFPDEIQAISLLSVQDKLSLSEQGLFSSAFIAGRAAGLTNTEASLFAVFHINMELILETNGLGSNISLVDLALAFKTAITIALTRGIGEADATNFATPMVRVQSVSGLQSADVITQFADMFKRALEIGEMEGMDVTQRVTFASDVLTIQQFFGVQTQATLVTFAKSFMSFWSVGVELGMSPGDAFRFAWVLLQIQARLGTLSVERVRQAGQEYLGGIVAALARGESATMARISTLMEIIVESGVRLLRGSTSTPTPVKVKVEETGGHGSLIDIADVGLFNNLGERVLSNLQLLTGSSTIKEEGGGLLSGLLKGRENQEGLQYGPDSFRIAEIRRSRRQFPRVNVNRSRNVSGQQR